MIQFTGSSGRECYGNNVCSIAEQYFSVATTFDVLVSLLCWGPIPLFFSNRSAHAFGGGFFFRNFLNWQRCRGYLELTSLPHWESSSSLFGFDTMMTGSHWPRYVRFCTIDVFAAIQVNFNSKSTLASYCENDYITCSVMFATMPLMAINTPRAWTCGGLLVQFCYHLLRQVQSRYCAISGFF